MTLKTKLTGGFLLITLVAVAIAMIGYTQIHKLVAADTKMFVSIVQPMAQLEAIAIGFQRQRVNAQDLLSHSDKDAQEEFIERITKLDTEIIKTAQSYEKTLYSDEGKKLFKEFQQAYSNYEAGKSRLLALVKEGKTIEARALLEGDQFKAARALQQAIDNLVASKSRQGEILAKSNTALANSAGRLMLGLAGGGLVLSLVLPMATIRAFSAPVTQLISDARRIADGDLTVSVQNRSQDEIGQLADAFRSMVDGLRQALQAAEAAAQLKGQSLILLEQEMLERQKADEALQNLNLSLESRIAEEVRKNREKDGMLLHQDKLASIGQLAAGVAHEINNPMGFIMGNLNTLKEYVISLQKYCRFVDETVPENSRSVLQEFRKQLDLDYILDDLQPLLVESSEGAERVRRIVLDLKDFARPDEQEMYEADLNQLTQSTINIVRNELRYVAQLDLQLGELPLVVCHPQQINQVISNLLVNAAHALEQQGVITVRTWQEGSFVVLSVADTGKGILPENLTRIFDPFFTTKEVGKGTGLGLSISYDIIKKHGGEITVASEAGKGTIFTVQLPIAFEG
jgi:two-component system NtrC family sensor kinase